MSKFLIKVPDAWDSAVAGALAAAVSNPDACPNLAVERQVEILGPPETDADGFIVHPNRMLVRREVPPASPPVDRLYGLRDDDEYLFGDADEVVEYYLTQEFDHERGWNLEILEWSVKPQRSFLPDADDALQRLCEWYLEGAEINGDGYERWDEATADEGVLAAMEYTLSLWASKVHYHMADKLLSRTKTRLRRLTLAELNLSRAHPDPGVYVVEDAHGPPLGARAFAYRTAEELIAGGVIEE